MYKTKEELRQEFINFICYGWRETAESASKVVDQMIESAELITVAQLKQLFTKSYGLQSPLDFAGTWQYLFGMKALTLWDDVEEVINRHHQTMMANFASEGKIDVSDVKHIEFLAMPEQAAVMKELDLNDGCIGTEFYKGIIAHYPDVAELHCLHMVYAMKNGDNETARACILQMDKQYPDDFELLKKSLDIYTQDGNKEEIHELGERAVRVAKKNPHKYAYQLTHYTAMEQTAAEDYEGAVETYSWLITNNNLLNYRDDKELNSLFNIFFEIFSMPSNYIEDKIMLFAIQFNFFITTLRKNGVDLDVEVNASMLGNCVVRLSEKIANKKVREAFVTILDYLEKEKFLQDPAFKTIITSGYACVESYVINTDLDIPGEVRNALLMLYAAATTDFRVNDAQTSVLQVYFSDNNSEHKKMMKEKYPYGYEYVSKLLKDAAKKKNAGPSQTVKRMEKKIGRNDPCPCGSGKKYKKCCGK